MLPILEIKFGDVLFQPNENCAYVGRTAITLTKQESYLLEALALCEGTMVTRTMLNAIRHKDTGFKPSNDNQVDSHICRLRRKLHKSKRVHIRTVAKHGFKLSVV